MTSLMLTLLKMNKLFNTLLLLGSALLLGSCTYFGNKEVNLKAHGHLLESTLEEEVRVNLKAASDSIKLLPPEYERREVVVAEEFVDSSILIMGTPDKDKVIDVAPLVSEDESVRNKARKKLDKREEYIDSLIAENRDTQNELQHVRNQLVEMGKKYEEERNNTIVAKIKRFIGTTVGLVVVVALGIALFPALPSILGLFLGFITNAVPGLISLFGVTSKNLSTGLVTSIDSFKNNIRNNSTLHTSHTKEELSIRLDKGERLYTKEDVIELLNTELHKHTDKKDRKVINSLKQRHIRK